MKTSTKVLAMLAVALLVFAQLDTARASIEANPATNRRQLLAMTYYPMSKCTYISTPKHECKKGWMPGCCGGGTNSAGRCAVHKTMNSMPKCDKGKRACCQM